MGLDKSADESIGATNDATTGERAERWRGIDHVQVAIPPAGEARAREFYAGVLGLSEQVKPDALAARGGAWFESGATRLHVGVDPDFVPARKAHPALLVVGLRDLVSSGGIDAIWSDEIPGTVRCHIHDPFGNRIELIDADGAIAAVAELGAGS